MNDVLGSKCAPKYATGTADGIDGKKSNFTTCFSLSALETIIKAYNRHHMSDKISYDKTKMTTKKELWNKIQDKMEKQCGKDETCWLEQKFMRNSNLDDFFKPIAPLGKYQWLTTDDIHNVMKQWDDKYIDYKFVGALPMDFLELGDFGSRYLQNLNLSLSSYRNIGTVFNIDASDKAGSHWVALNINTQRGEYNYYDSYGSAKKFPNLYNLSYFDSNGVKIENKDKIPLPTEIQKLYYRLMKKTDKPYRLNINSTRHQYANSECGVFSMMFLLKSLNQSFGKIVRDMMGDEEINKMRDSLFFRKNST